MKVRFRWGPRGGQGGRGWVLGKGGRSQEGEGLRLKDLLQWRITGLNVNITTQYECVSCLVIAIIVAFVVIIHVQCLVPVDLSLVKIKYSLCV